MHDFTEAAYEALLHAALKRFRIAPVTDSEPEDGIALWRHDVDFSLQRARAIAKIEARLGVRSSFYVLLSSNFYNIIEFENREILHEIAALGHDIGIHFDASIQSGDNLEDFEALLKREADIVSWLVGREVCSFSVHNPTVTGKVKFESEQHAGLLNASAPALYERYTYCSDSNGLWRFRSLHDVVSDASVKRLYALTHPEWWTPGAMMPRDKVKRCIDGRAYRTAQSYDALLEKHGRPNLK